MSRLPCFKAYDIRGRVPHDLNEDVAYKIGRAFARVINPAGPVAIGRDIRESSPALSLALIHGLNDAGVDVVDIGLCGTEMVYFAAALPGMGGGVMVTASHNPIEYNGMKLVSAGAVPISGPTGLDDIERRVRENDLGEKASVAGRHAADDISADYVKKVLSFVDVAALKPLKILANPGNGCAGPFVKKIAAFLPFEMVMIHDEPDASFPNGIPNPLLPENQPATAAATRKNRCDLGVAWDGDFDRCFFFDETGCFVDGYYIVGLLAQHLVKMFPGSKIIHDPRMTWNTIDLVREAGGVPVESKTGHAFIKEAMRGEDAVYGGEMSAHHYFRDFFYCDSGMVPWLLVCALISASGQPLSALVAERKRRFPGSGEINRRVADPAAAIAAARRRYEADATVIKNVDGLSMEFGKRWRFNARASQTEPVLRLNVESFGDPDLVRAKTNEILALITA
ncbi:MAG: phosphomannomutase [Lentisphaeria bacterium]|nr:phosphomannomutase [Lentisphaeria bacterium]